jgi:hypothetical protein
MSSQLPPPSPSSCSRPVAIVTAIAVDSEWAASSPRSCCRWGRGSATFLEPPVPASLPSRAGRSPRSSSPACVEALPVRRGECRSRPRTPRRGTGPLRQRRRCGRRDASVSSPAAGVRPSFASQATAAGLGWHRRAKMVIKNDDSTVSVTNTGCIRCDNRCRVKIVRVDF